MLLAPPPPPPFDTHGSGAPDAEAGAGGSDSLSSCLLTARDGRVGLPADARGCALGPGGGYQAPRGPAARTNPAPTHLRACCNPAFPSQWRPRAARGLLLAAAAGGHAAARPFPPPTGPRAGPPAAATSPSPAPADLRGGAAAAERAPAGGTQGPALGSRSVPRPAPGHAGSGGGSAASTPAPASPTPAATPADLGSLLLRPSFDASLDWAANVTAKGAHGCTLPKKMAPPGRLPPRCPKPRRPVAAEEARRLGWRFAPILHQHPLDWTRLSDPGPWLSAATLIDPLTYTTTDLTAHLENRQRARRAKGETAAAMAAAAAAAASAAAGGGGDVAAAAAAAEAAVAAAAAADPYWLIHESYDAHNFFATRLVHRRRHGHGGDGGDAAAAKSVPAAAVGDNGGAGTGDGQPQQQQQHSGAERGARRSLSSTRSAGDGRAEGATAAEGGGEGGPDAAVPAAERDPEDPLTPQFEALQGAAFFEAIAGDPLEVEGEAGGGKARLGGKVYFTVFEPRLEHLRWSSAASAAPRSPHDAHPDAAAASEPAGEGEAEPAYAFVYTFWFFYPFNGCSNQLMATRFAGRHQGAEYWICPLGVHEGDWEHLKVYVCQDGMAAAADSGAEPASAVAALQYSQHTWLPTYDCTQGECAFEADPNGLRRPLVYAGLHSHANSPHTSNLNVYAKINFKQILNFDGIYVADRFAAGGPTFVPSAANTAWLPFPHEAEPADMRPGGRLAWAAYKGNWGVPLTSPNFSLTCLTHNLTAAGPCDPRNPPVFLLDRLLGGVEARPEQMLWTPVLNPKRVAPELAEGITGPLVRRAASGAWERELAAPLWDDREPLPGLGISLAALARDTSSLACPLTEDARRTWSSGGLGGAGADPRAGSRLRLFVAAATSAVLVAAAAAVLVVKCMPLLLAPHHRRTAGEGDPHETGVVYGKHASLYGRSGSPRYDPHPSDWEEGEAEADGRLMQRHGAGADGGRGLRHRTGSGVHAAPSDPAGPRATAAGGGGGGGSGASLSASSYNSSDDDMYGGSGSGAPTGPGEGASATEAVATPLHKARPGHRLNPPSPPRPLRSASGHGRAPDGGGGGHDGPGEEGSSDGGGSLRDVYGAGSHEKQPLLLGGAATADGGTRQQRRSSELGAEIGGGGAGSASGGGAWSVAVRAGSGGHPADERQGRDDEEGGKASPGCLRWAFPAVALLPLLALRGCLAACRWGRAGLALACSACCGRRGGAASRGGFLPLAMAPGGGPAAVGGRRQRRRGLGPYLLGCAVQPERRLLWLSLGVMAYSLGLILSAQGLLLTLHALRNLLLRGLWAIAGLEGVFVALLAACGVFELTLMVASIAMGPQPAVATLSTSSGGPRAPLPPRRQPSGAARDEVAAWRGPGGASGSPFGAAAAANGEQLIPLHVGGGSGAPAVVAVAVPVAAGEHRSSSGGAGGGGGAGSPVLSRRLPTTADIDPQTSVAAPFPPSSAAAVAATAAAAAATAAAAAAAAAAAVPWRTLALLAALGYQEIAAAVHLGLFGLGLWVGVLGASEGCSAAVQGLYRVISFSPDVCLDLSAIGVPGPRCGGDLMRLCNVWRQLQLSGLLYGSLLIIASRLLLLVMASANYHSRHAVLLPLLHNHRHHHFHHRGHREQNGGGGGGGGKDGGGDGIDGGFALQLQPRGGGTVEARRRRRRRSGAGAGEAGDKSTGSGVGGRQLQPPSLGSPLPGGGGREARTLGGGAAAAVAAASGSTTDGRASGLPPVAGGISGRARALAASSGRGTGLAVPMEPAAAAGAASAAGAPGAGAAVEMGQWQSMGAGRGGGAVGRS